MISRFDTSILRGARRRLDVLRGARREEGWALLISLIVMVVMLGFGMAVAGIADTQSKLGASTRQRDEATQLADAALNAEMFMLAINWPGPGTAPGFPVCTPSQTDTRCPSATLLRNLMNTPDTLGNVSWQINVYDNGIDQQGHSMQSFYSDSYTTGACTPSATASCPYDVDADGKMWVRAQATVGTVTKTVVALAQTEPAVTPLPHATIVAGSLQTSNNGNKVIIDTQGSSAPPPGTVYVRCNPATNSNCLVYDVSKNQISPDTTSPNYTGPSSFLSSALQTQLKAEAIYNGTYYAACPATQPSGAVVWIDSGNCSWSSNVSSNSPTAPGLLIINNGTVSFAGTSTFYGLIYALNTQASSGAVVTLGGNAQVVGAVFVDGNGGLVGGSSKLNVTFDVNALSTVSVLGNVGYIQSTWREL